MASFTAVFWPSCSFKFTGACEDLVCLGFLVRMVMDSEFDLCFSYLSLLFEFAFV